MGFIVVRLLAMFCLCFAALLFLVSMAVLIGMALS